MAPRRRSRKNRQRTPERVAGERQHDKNQNGGSPGGRQGWKHCFYPTNQSESQQAIENPNKRPNLETSYRGLETSYRRKVTLVWRKETLVWRKETLVHESETFFWPISANKVAI